MPTTNLTVAAIFEEIADLLEIQGANPFRIRAYRNGARTANALGRDLKQLVARGQDLTALPGIGEDLAAKIVEIAQTGHCAALDRLHRQLPAAITELLKIPGVGPRRVRVLYDELDVHTGEQLLKAARDGRLEALHGFGPKLAQKIVESLEHRAQVPHRFKLAAVAPIAEELARYLRAVAGVERVEVAGSLRRRRETVGDLDILVVAGAAAPVMEKLRAYGDLREVIAAGPTRGSAILNNGLQVDVRIVEAQSYGAALHYFTGSKGHNIAIRRLAQERGLKVNEYGVFRGRTRVAGDTEESVYEAVGLPYVPPELREDRGEIEAARAGGLPKLVELADLRGDLHAHSRASDGRNTLAEMAQAAAGGGLTYLAITEHSRRLGIAHGLDPVRLAKQGGEIERLNERLSGLTLLKGIEVDILDDGSLDLPDSALARLDVVIGAVHSKFDLSRARQTERILKAMEHPHFHILAHPTGRLIEEREPYDVDMLKVIRKARECNVALEINAHPERLDLLDTYCRMAKDEGVLVAIDSDAHSVLEFDYLNYGVGQARRGWIEKADVLNARPLAELRKLLEGKRR